MNGIDAADCRVEPRPLEDFEALLEASPGAFASARLGTPAATPAPPTDGTPADAAVVAAIQAAVEEQVACALTRDIRRITALWSGDLFLQTLAGTDLTDVLAATPSPLPAIDEGQVPTVADVQILPDGRVSALVGSEEERSRVVFVESDGRYLLDSGVDLVRADTPTP